MCFEEIPGRDADESLPTTDRESAFGVPNFCALLSKLKCTTALADGRRKRREYLRKYAQTERGKETIRKYTERNRAKRNAYNRMRHARKMGVLVKPSLCETCGEKGKIEAHHDDYSKPLVVRWLCRQCHKTWHRKNGKALNG